MLTRKLARATLTIHYTVDRCILFLVFLIEDTRKSWHSLIGSVDLANDAGEGVISTAIVVMIMAFLAVGLWVAFKLIMSNATSSISTQVSKLGQ
ncbi:MAG: hypothetical protein ACYCWN_05470 [Ferrimicrobium sp.]|uniref:Flagellin N-terminal-like domain-containing protein n=1 Tax=Ferrimicrobium acidiphilum TaxID=121039 RepID=A0ABV3Y3L6_9ACTN|nr:hypothetical protein [Ferrimicrobium sp.]MCL5974053.1 hypothetical protein [Actinomycetota bacterium]